MALYQLPGSNAVEAADGVKQLIAEAKKRFPEGIDYGYDRKTIRKYLIQPEAAPVYGPRPALPSKLDPFKPYLEERLKAGVWNAQVLLRELRARGYPGGYTILKDWLHPQRASAQAVAVRRFA